MRFRVAGVWGHSFSEPVFLSGQALPGCFGNLQVSRTRPPSQEIQNAAEEVAAVAPAGTDVNMKNRSSFRTRRCRELWCGSQMRLGSCVAVATAPIRPLAWEPPCAGGAALGKKKKNRYTKKAL